MLYIKAKLGTGVMNFEGYIGQGIRLCGEKINPLEFSDAEFEVQADCDELDYIKFNFQNVPYNKKIPVQTWLGDMAKFIVMNWS
jgi:hypothetical protein